MVFIGPNDILVTQKNDGRVRRVIGNVLQSGQVLDVGVDSQSERGLLGLALHPEFPGTPLVYVYYTESGSSMGADTSGQPGQPAPVANRVYQYTWNGSALVNPVLRLQLPVTPGPNHDGGKILFGPDGKLYVVIGDLNRNGQLQNNPTGAPDDTGVILRLNPDGIIPSDNPFASQGGNLAKYYAYGIRNSFGMAFDPVTNRLWMTENGPDVYDEINLVDPGLNSGWNRLMGPDSRDPQGLGDLFQVPGSHYADPKFSWQDPVGLTAIVFLNSGQLGASYVNDAFVGDINNGHLYHFVPNAARDGFVFSNPDLADLVADSGDGGELTETILGTGFQGITDLKVGPDGRLYVLSYGGRILAISAVSGGPALSVRPTSAVPGSTVTATWSGINSPSPTDWMGLYAAGAPDTAFLEWDYVSCSRTPTTAQAAGSCPLTLPSGLAAGSYELRLFSNNGFVRLAASEALTVAANLSFSVMPTSVPMGGTVTATWSGISAPTATDWIGLYAAGAPDTAYIEWIYVSCSQTPTSPASSGSCPFTMPSGLAFGPYELRLFSNNGFVRVAASAFTVTSNASLSVNPTSVPRGSSVTATWGGIQGPSPTDWLGLFAPQTPNTAFITWVYVSCSQTPGTAQAAGSCQFVIPPGLNPGTYELRLLANNGFVGLAVSQPLNVTP
jgi:glucose/arabinose dehydrogenase